MRTLGRLRNSQCNSLAKLFQGRAHKCPLFETIDIKCIDTEAIVVRLLYV